jgi:cytochrome b561/polyisoprenoid-binding protein YceI
VTQAEGLAYSTSGQSARYSIVAIVLHWLIALALAFELALGFAMPKGPEGFALWQTHKSVGITILLLSIVRIGWRLFHKPPASLEGGLSHALARAVHFAFYAFMFLAPLTGWAMVSTSQTGIPTILFGLIPVPDLPVPAALNGAAKQSHEVLAWLGLSLIAVHAAGVLRHDLVLRRGVLGRMSPAGAPWAGIVLSVSALIVGFAAFMSIAGQVPSGKSGDLAAGLTGDVKTPSAPASMAPPQNAAERAKDEAAVPDGTAPAVTTRSSAHPSVPPVWSIQPGGSLAFSVANGSEAVEGNFAKWGGTIRFDPDRPENARILIEVDLASATVGDATQDKMLAGDEYFSVARFPKAVLRATSARRIGAGHYVAQGALELKGVARPQTIDFRLSGAGSKRHVEGNASIARAPFDIGMGETGGDLAPLVRVHFSFDAEAELSADQAKPSNRIQLRPR